ncbi:MAG: cysteine--tRNA ligase [Bacteroidetes bacterium]|jgi:cysteinyl-tRNA synthetase|nr:cysteine--tRNA ligase [Bacteroidota bacterium]
MSNNLLIYNTLSRKKEPFEPINPPHVGLYVCGPTVYGHTHLGHARPAITFDIVFRYLRHLGYKVRYVRNITDVGHLENDADEGEDKISKKARLEQLEPMEIVQQYVSLYRHHMARLNVLMPGIEPLASGHIIEQQQMIKAIIDKGYAYEKNGSVYFNVLKYNQDHHYGVLSGRKIEDLQSNTRALEGQDEKANPLDFALWKKASPEHIMRWPSEWSDGFPGWHLECSAMSTKYLGETFDIHGGGMDLLFPHHECEIAQSMAANGKSQAKYWMHNNMITINGQKMGRSLNNFINLDQFFDGTHKLLEKAYSPMTIRFFMLQAHYTSTLDFSNDALQAAEKGFDRLMKAGETLLTLKPSDQSSVDVKALHEKCYEAMNDNFNTPIVISHLFDAVRTINSIADGNETINAKELELLQSTFNTFVYDVLGLQANEQAAKPSNDLSAQLIDMLLNLRMDAKHKKDFATADAIRDQLTQLGVEIRDKKDGFEWEIK